MSQTHWKTELARDGVVHLPAVLDSGDAEKLATLSLQSINDYSASEDMYRTSEGVPIKLAYPFNKYQDFISVLGNKKIIAIVDSLFPKEDSVLTWEDVLIKMPNRGAAVFPHQDISLKATGESAYALGISLHADHTNPVFFLPGSHRLGPLTATAVRIIYQECMHKFTPIATQPGDIVIHDVHTLHYSEPNRAKQPRCTWYVEFRSMQSLFENGPWNHDWVHRRRAIWLYIRASTGISVGENETDAVKDYLARLPNEPDCFRVPHINATVRYDESSPYNHFAPATDD